MTIRLHTGLEAPLLLSLVNTKLRNESLDLSSLCRRYELDGDLLTQKMTLLGMHYQPQLRQFRAVEIKPNS